jgi:hypothetical protein
MSEPTTYPIRAVTIDDKLYMTYIKLLKPQYAPYLASIQAVMNQYIVPYAYFAMANARGALDPTVLSTYTSSAQNKINEALGPFSVTFTLNAQGIAGGLRLLFEARKGTNVVSTDHEIKGQGPDFGPVYEQSKDIAKARWASYPEAINEANVLSILGLAQLGYERFMTEGTPTPRQQLAVLKHKIKLNAVDPVEYINRLRDSVNKYEVGYQKGVSKYSYVIKWISEGLVAAFKASKIVYEVL